MQPYLKQCLITNIYCFPSCVCDTGYGGDDCSLTAEQLLSRDINRGLLCEALINVTSFLNPSSSLTSTLIGSLFVSYSQSEVVSQNSTKKCSSALELVSNFSSDGYLVGTTYNTREDLINIVSAYVKPSQTGVSSYLDDILSQITSGLLLTLENGEFPMELVSSNVRISVQKTFIAELTNALLIPPASPASVAYAAPSPSFQFFRNNSRACLSTTAYSHFSVAEWGRNPFPNASSIRSPMLRFSGNFKETIPVVEEETSAYFVNLPFSETQSFNLNISIDDLNAHQILNLTFPNCTIFEDGGYVSCRNCVIATYTNDNVTFFCSNLRNLCQNSVFSTSRRHLGFLPEPSFQSTVGMIGIESRRSLSGDDVYFSDDSTSLGSGMTAQQYGALLENTGVSFANVLSSNPFAINIAEAKLILSFVGGLVLFFFFGMTLFSSWDHFDRYQFVYGYKWPPKGFLTPYVLSNGMLPVFWGTEEKMKMKDKYFEKNSQSQSQSTTLNEGVAQHEPNTSSKFSFMKTFFSKKIKMKDEDFSILEGIFADSGKSSNTLFAKEIAQFFELVVPPIFEFSNFFQLIRVVLMKHDYLTIFFHPSSEKNRFMRWMDLYNSILNGLFISTLFFGTFYSNTGQCESYATSADCLKPINSITGESQCVWTLKKNSDPGSCTLREPPANFSFTIILALTCTLIGAPLQIFVSFILDEYCSKRPRFEDIGLSTEKWLGVGLRTVPLEISFQKEAPKSTHDVRSESQLFRSSQSVNGLNRNEVKSNLPSHFLHRFVSENKLEEEHSGMSRNEFALQRSLDNLLTVDEEIERILFLISDYYAIQETLEYKTFLANLTAIQLQTWIELNDSKKFEILRVFGLKSNGRFLPLSLWDSLRYTSRQRKLTTTFERIRRRMEEIQGQLIELEEINQVSLQEIVFLYSFILEQFPAFKQWDDSRHFLCANSQDLVSLFYCVFHHQTSAN
jgi:hypothetical protein